MTQKINGAAYSGIWVEKQVAFIKLTFNHDLTGITATHMYLTGTTTQTTTTSVGDTSFGVVESAIVQALKQLELKATVLGISALSSAGTVVDVMVGCSEGYFSDNVGLIASGLATGGAKAVITTAGGNTVLGQLVDMVPGYVTFTMEFAAFDGTMPVATVANGDLETGVGSTPATAALPNGAPIGSANSYQPVALITA